MATTGDFHAVVAVADGWCWWQLSSPSDDAWVVVDVIDAEGCPGFISGGGCVVRAHEMRPKIQDSHMECEIGSSKPLRRWNHVSGETANLYLQNMPRGSNVITS